MKKYVRLDKLMQNKKRRDQRKMGAYGKAAVEYEGGRLERMQRACYGKRT